MGEQQLLENCKAGRVEEIRVALEAVEDPNSTGTRKRTCLMFAVDCSRIEVVALLLSCDGITVNEKDEDNRTALHDACRRGNVDILRKLLAFPGLLLDERDIAGFTPVILAALLSPSSLCLHLMAAKPEVDLDLDVDADLLCNNLVAMG